MPDTALLLKQINNASGKWCTAVDLANVGQGVFFQSYQKQLAFTWGGWELSFTVLLQAFVSSPTPSHGVIQRDLSHRMDPPYQCHHTGCGGEEEAAGTLEALYKKHALQRVGGNL